MSDPFKPPIGSIGWCDLTVPDVDTVRDFYRDVVGWTATDVDMGGYAVVRDPEGAVCALYENGD